jgi:predicted dehydrogenase
VKVGLLGTGFGRAHAGIYHDHSDIDSIVVFGRTAAKLEQFATDFGFSTTTDIDQVYGDPTIDLIDVCLPTGLHADHVIRALDADKHVLCELPLATSIDDAQRVIDAQAASDRQVFVDMAGRFDPATEFLSTAIAGDTYGPLKTLHIEVRSALLWEGYDLGLDSIAMDVMHGNLDVVATALGLPEATYLAGVVKEPRGSAAEVLLTYPEAIVHCGACTMPQSYGLRGGYRATFNDTAIESSWTAGWDGRPTGTLTEYTDTAPRDIDLPAVDTYAAVIDHVLDCLAGRATSRLAPASVLDSLQLTLDIHHSLTATPHR